MVAEKANPIFNRPLQKKTNLPKSNAWVAYHRPNPHARLRLFCFPYAGGGASVYRTWVNNLLPDVDVMPVQYPGREGRISEEHVTNPDALADAALEGLASYFDRPFAFFGHSMGARLAFDITRRLQEQKREMPAQLFISGCRAPRIPDPEPPIHELPEKEFIDELRIYNGTPKSVLENDELMTLYMPTLRADFGLCASHPLLQPEPLLSCPMSIYGGLQDHKLPKKELEAWRAYTQETFLLRMFPGDHFFIHSGQDLVLRILCRELAQLAQTT